MIPVGKWKLINTALFAALRGMVSGEERSPLFQRALEPIFRKQFRTPPA